jgi:hypothetical protein
MLSERFSVIGARGRLCVNRTCKNYALGVSGVNHDGFGTRTACNKDADP